MESRVAPPRPRDRAAEITAAIDWVTSGAGPVRLGAGAATARLEFTASADESTGPWLRFTGAAGELRADGDTLRVGLGTAGDAQRSVEHVRAAGEAAGKALTTGSFVQVVFPEDLPQQLVTAAADGMASGYAGTGSVELSVAPALRKPVARGLLTAAVVRLAALLVSAPANVLTPARTAEWAEQIAARAGLTCTLLGPDELTAGGFGALLAIGAGSTDGPRLVRLTRTARPGAPTIALVGKGITFDSGGLSLKSPAAMQPMRMDVAGAATVLAALAAIPHLDPGVGITAVLPLAENLVGPDAVRPGDVVRAWNGTEIQILDTDFEGRVVLADALALAASTRPDLLVDLATLTYQAEIALGPDIAAVLGRDDLAVQRWLDAAATAGEPMWRLPWAHRYLDQVRTPSGVRNHPLRDTGRALTAALFLGEFVPADVPWVHCDMSGPAWRGDASVDGATGFGARTLLALLDNLSEGHRS